MHKTLLVRDKDDYADLRMVDTSSKAAFGRKTSLVPRGDDVTTIVCRRIGSVWVVVFEHG